MPEPRVVFTEEDYRRAIDARAAKTIGGPLSPPERNAVVTDARPVPTLTHIRDLLAEPDDAVSWIVDGILPAGGLSVFVAKPKAGKSTTARAIALRVSRGEPVLGRATAAGPVIYLGLEDHRRVTKGHFRTLGAHEGDDLYVWTGARPGEAMIWLERTLAGVDPVLVVVDTMQHLLGMVNLNDYAEVVTKLGPVLNLVRPRQSHLMLVHHAGKGDRTGFDAILGSTGILGTVDTALLLRRREDDTRTLATRQRTGEDLLESVLVLNDQQEPQLVGLRADHDQQQAEARVIEWLAKQPDPVSRAEVLAGVEGDANVNTRALYALAKRSEQVRRTGKGVKGDPFLYTCIPIYPHAGMQEAETGQEVSNVAPDTCMASSGVPAPPAPAVMQESDATPGAGDAWEPEPADASPALTVTDLGGGVFLVDGGAEPHDVTLAADGSATCNCPDHLYRKRECKHIRAVRGLA